MSKENKKRKIKKGFLFQFIFCTLSIIFIIGCCVFYGTRLIKYYKIYNPTDENGEKTEYLYMNIVKNNSIVYEGEGLYMTGGNYIYKGIKVDNYVKYANMLWRIIKINTDNTIDIALDSSINELKWNKDITTYDKSDINEYLNDVFLRYLDTSYLEKSIICLDDVKNIKDYTCDETNKDYYVRLLNANEFINSQKNGTYLDNKQQLWTSTTAGEQVWYMNGNTLDKDYTDTMYYIKPVITLKASVTYKDGDGTISNPYIVSEDKKELTIGSYVKLDSDIWIVYEVKDNGVKLILNELYDDGKTEYQFSNSNYSYDETKSYTLAKYLNKVILPKISYKDLIKESEWYIGEYDDSYKDVYKKTTKAKIGLYNIADLKYNFDLDNYYLITPSTNSYVYNWNKKTFKVEKTLTNKKGIRPAIEINKLNIKSGIGTSTNPYELEM